MQKVHVESFGCQMNKLDTSLVVSALKQAGYGFTDKVKDADVVVINTCSVRDHAEQRVLSHLGHLKHIKQHKPDLIVAVIGCMAQRLGDKLLSHEAVNVVCGPMQIAQITHLIAGAQAANAKRSAVAAEIRRKEIESQQALERFEEEFGSQISNLKSEIPDSGPASQAYVRVMHGCNNFCTYCVVPYVRGPEVCREPAAIIEQIKRLADAGVRQVTLLGQTVNAYKYTSGQKTYSLADLLDMTAQVDGIEWIRFVTSYPAEAFYEDILAVMATSPKICHYLHMPAQSGSDRILRAMNRHYTAQRYLEFLERARAIVPDIGVAGDFIVGFPGETDEDFEATADLVRRARYKNCFVFKYSPRPGTTADKRGEDNVPPEVKQQRNVALLAIQETVSTEINSGYLGQTVRVLVEGPSKKARVNTTESGHLQLVGRTGGDSIVVFDGPALLAGRFADVQIVRTSSLTLFGQLDRA
jgi:tRNA-2-methylthio-N6-dimethylallyladenosine synthase